MKQLDATLVEQFKQDWDTSSMRALCKKYNVKDTNVLNRWATQHGCPMPKKRVLKPKSIINTSEVTPQGLMAQAKPDLNKVGFEHNDELKACNEEFMKVINDTAMPKREKDALLFNIAERAMSIYIGLQPSTNQYMSCMVDFYKLKLYEKRVNISDKESVEIDAATLKSLKKKHIQEALDGICGELTVSEKGFFEHLVNCATTRILGRRKKLNDAMQNRARELSGHPVPAPDDVVDDMNINGVEGNS